MSEPILTSQASTGLQTDKTGIPLKRVLGTGSAILLVAGSMIGTGVFKKIVPMAQTGLNSYFVLGAWIAAGLITLFGAFTIAGLAKLTTSSGGIYEYMRIIYGDFLSFLLGWTGFTIVCSGSVAAVSFIFAQSVGSLVTLPDPLYHLHDISIANYIFPFSDSGIKILAISAIIVLTWLNYYGIKKGAGLNNIVTGAKILGILLLISLGFLFTVSPGDVAPLHPFIGRQVNSGISSVFLMAIFSAFWAYSGFTEVAYVSGEIKKPKRNVAVAVIVGVILVMVLYVLVNDAYIKILSLEQLSELKGNDIAAIIVAGSILGRPGTILVSILIIISTFGFLNVSLIFYSRLYYKMAREGMFFKHLVKVHPLYRTPYVALIYSMVWSIVLVVSGTFERLSNMVVFANFIFYALLAIGLVSMKIKGRIKDKVPFYPWAPLIFTLFSIALLINTLIERPRLAFMGCILMLSGVPFYFYFKIHKNREHIVS